MSAPAAVTLEVRLKGKRAKRGSYRLKLSARSAGGQTATERIRLRLTRRPRR